MKRRATARNLTRLDSALSLCLDEIELGLATVEECLAHYPDLRPELDEALRAALALREARRLEPRTAFKHGARIRLLARLAASRRVPVAGVVPARHRTFHLSPAGMLATALLAVILLSLGTAAVADAAAPGDPLYPLDRSIETLRVRLAPSSEAALQLELRFVEERLREAEQAAQRGRHEQFWQALGQYGQSVAAVARASRGNSAAEARLDAVLQGQQGQLDRVIGLLAPAGTGTPPAQGCTGVSDHPVALELARTYSISPAEVMDWFCRGYGFGEIAQALEASQRTGIPAADLLAMRASGLGWGQIWREVEQQATTPAPLPPTAGPTPEPAATATPGETPSPGNSGGHPEHPEHPAHPVKTPEPSPSPEPTATRETGRPEHPQHPDHPEQSRRPTPTPVP